MRCLLAFTFFLSPFSLFAKPNVMLFLADDMGWMDSGAYGSQYYETPHIDAFAMTAMRFAQAYSQPLCSPTRASLMSGQYSARHGITSATGHTPPQAPDHDFLRPRPATEPMLTPESKNYLEPSQITLAETLKAAGYATAHIGKWHLGLTPPHWPEQQGFDTAFHCHPDPGPPGEYFSPYGVTPERKPTAKSKVGTITNGPEGEYIVDRQAAEAVTFIQAHKSGPFFLNLWCYGVHGPWGHKEEYTRYFANKKDPSGRQGNPIMASMLKSVDECFGRIVQELKAQGISDNTIIIFTSDNGGNTHSNTSTEGKKSANADWVKWAGTQAPTSNAPLRDGKGTLYEGGTRVPLLWSWAGQIQPGSLTDAVVGPIDIYPTVIDLLGMEKPAAQVFDGVSYASVLKGKAPLQREAYFNYHPHAGANRAGGVWVRQGNWKLLRWFGNPATHELYDLSQDLGEAHDLGTAQPDKVKAMGRLIDGFLADTDALYPRENPAYKGAPATVADPLGGWKERQCKGSIADGILTLQTKSIAFLGRAFGRATGPATMKLKLRVTKVGHGKIERYPAGSGVAVGKTEEAYEVKPGAWQDIEVQLSAPGPLGVLRLYLPAGEGQTVEIDSIELLPNKGKRERWDF